MIQHIDVFYSELILENLNAELFNETVNFLQHLQQCRNQYSESNMLEWLSTCLEKSVFEWFNDQSKFTFLYEFDITLTNAFLLKQNNSSFFSILASESTCEIFENSTNFTLIVSIASSISSKKQQKLKVSISKCCQWCQSNYENYYSHRLQYFSCNVRNQQTYESALQFLEKKICEIFENLAIFALIISFVSSAQQKSNVLKIAKKTKFNAVKNVKRVKSKVLKAEEIAKSTSTLQNIDIFDSTFTCENRQFSEFVKFLQHFQQCQSLYRKSDLLMLLFICLWNFAFDIWFVKQTIMKSASLNEWIEILRVDFANVSFAKIQKIICMRCDSSFDFKKRFRQHVRNQHAKKRINNSNLMINAIKSACEVVEKSTIIDLFDSFVLQESLAFSATPRKHVSKSEIIFETIISSTNSILSIATVNNALQSMKNESIQCFFVSRISFSTLESEDQKIQISKFVKNFHLSINAINLVCEAMKMSIIACSLVSQKFDISIATSRQKFESVMIFEIVIASKRSHFSFIAFETVSNSTENTSTQCSFTSSKSSSSQTIESKSQKIFVWKLSEFCSFLSIDTIKSICESKKNSTVTCSFASFISQNSFTFFSVFKKRCYRCRINVLSIQKHYFEFHSCDETLRHRLKQQLVRRAHQQKQEIQKQAEVEKTISRSISSICLNFSIATSEIKSKSTKKSATCRRCNKIFNFNNKFHKHIREHYARKLVKNLNFRNFTSEFTYKIIEKSADIRSFVSFISQKSSIFFETSRSQKFWFSMIFESIFASTHLNFSIATYKINSKSIKNAIVVCPLTFSFISRIFVRKFHKSHIQKSHFIMNDLNRMFAEKFKSFDLQQHQNRRFSSQSFDVRQFRFAFSKKSYLIIENLFEMFDEKFKKKNLFQNQSNVFFQAFSNQMKIIFYFKSTINQKSSINQNSKSSKSKNLNQHMFAKSIRIAFSRNLSEKLINLSYKSTNVFCVKNRFLQILDFYKSGFSKSRISVKISFLILVLLRLFSIFFLVFAFVSIVSATKTNCINVYEQVVSIIDRAIR